MSSTAVDSLLRERAGYVARGLANRVAQVDAELAKLGHHAEPFVERAAPDAFETPEAPRPRARRKP